MPSKAVVGNWPRQTSQQDVQLRWSDLIFLLRDIVWPTGSGLRQALMLSLFFGLTAAGSVISLFVPFALGFAIDALTPLEAKAGTLWVLPLVAIGAYGAFRVLEVLFKAVASLIMDLNLFQGIVMTSGRVYRHVLHLPMHFHLDTKKGGVTRGIDRGIGTLETLTNRIFSVSFTLGVDIIGSMVLLATQFGWLEILVVVSMGAAYFLFVRIMDPIRSRLLLKVNKAEDHINDGVVESLTHTETVKLFASEDRQLEAVRDGLHDYRRSSMRVTIYWQFRQVGVQLIFGIGLVVIMLIGGWKVMHVDDFTVGKFVALTTLAVRMTQPIRGIGLTARGLIDNLIQAQRLLDLLKVKDTLPDKPGAPAFAPQHGAITFDAVGFTYPGTDRKILNDVSFKCPAGSTTAVVGPTGGGKSTIVKLLLRLYERDEGLVSLDGQDVAEVQQKSLRRAVGVVPQDCVLFHDSIAANIRYARPDAQDDEVIAAAKTAKLHDFVVALTDGYGTIIGDRGLKLSGGERQRVALARALLVNPVLFVFDEATSALDSTTEAEIQGNLMNATAGKSRLVIAHRLSTIADADQILVVDSGAIVERGTHPQLLALSGVYASLWEQQAKI